jgi:hypothetical protein
VPTSRKRDADRLGAFELLAACRDGCTEEAMIADVAGARAIEVATMRTTRERRQENE